MLKEGQKALIILDDWVHTPEGDNCKSVWGTIHIIEADKLLGLKPNKNSTNWYVQIGSNEKGVIVAGCRIHYCFLCNNKPKDKYKRTMYVDKDSKIKYKATRIYIAE